jgi:hypothetical protein
VSIQDLHLNFTLLPVICRNSWVQRRIQRKISKINRELNTN